MRQTWNEIKLLITMFISRQLYKQYLFCYPKKNTHSEGNLINA